MYLWPYNWGGQQAEFGPRTVVHWPLIWKSFSLSLPHASFPCLIFHCSFSIHLTQGHPLPLLSKSFHSMLCKLHCMSYVSQFRMSYSSHRDIYPCCLNEAGRMDAPAPLSRGDCWFSSTIHILLLFAFFFPTELACSTCFTCCGFESHIYPTTTYPPSLDPISVLYWPRGHSSPFIKHIHSWLKFSISTPVSAIVLSDLDI